MKVNMIGVGVGGSMSVIVRLLEIEIIMTEAEEVEKVLIDLISVSHFISQKLTVKGATASVLGLTSSTLAKAMDTTGTFLEVEDSMIMIVKEEE